MTDLKNQLLTIFKEVLEKDDIDENVVMETCLEWDSLNHLTLMSEIETRLNISFTTDEVYSVQSFKEILDLVKSRIQTEI